MANIVFPFFYIEDKSFLIMSDYFCRYRFSSPQIGNEYSLLCCNSLTFQTPLFCPQSNTKISKSQVKYPIIRIVHHWTCLENYTQRFILYKLYKKWKIFNKPCRYLYFIFCIFIKIASDSFRKKSTCNFL